MAQLTTQQVSVLGTVANLVAASAGGDTITPSDRAALLVRNAGGSAVTVTVVVPGNTKYGQAAPDVPVSVAAGATTVIGPLPSDLADPITGQVAITYSAVTSVTVAGIAI